MKELYMEMLEEEFLSGSYGEAVSAPPEPIGTDITCPNCTKGKLQFIKVNDIVCYEPGCGQSFVLVNANTVRYK